MKGLVAVFAVLLLAIPTKLEASHALGADITYECVGPNTYNIVLSFYRDCDGISAPTSETVTFSNSCGLSQASLTLTTGAGCTNAQGQCCGDELPGVCGAQLPNTTCNNGNLPGVEVYTYCGTVTLPGPCEDWTVSYGLCCRNSAITNLTNASSFDQYVETTINNTSNICNNSPIFTNNPSQLFCADNFYCYNHGVVDFDGDSLVFSLIQPLDAANTPINYAPGYSVNIPMSVAPGSFSFDTNTGQICFEPDQTQAAVITVLVEEYRDINGVPTVVGSTMRDIQFQVLSAANCSGGQPDAPTLTNPQGAGIIDSVSVQMCPGNVVTFDVVSTDPNGNNITMSSNVGSAIPGATFTIAPATPDTFAIGTFSWAPGPGDAGLNFFTVTVENDGCPVPSSATRTIQVFVYEDVTIATSSNAFCGDTIQLNAIGGSTFTWSPTTGLTDPNIPDPKLVPTQPTMYVVTSDCGADSVFIDVTPPYTVDAGPDTSICLNGLVQLNATVSGPGSQGIHAPVTYTWRPAGNAVGLDSSDRNRFDPPVSPPTDQVFYVTTLNAQGCIQEDSVLVSVTGVAPDVEAYVTPDTVCPGGTVQLEVSTAPQQCQLSTRPCVTNSVEYTVGTGSTASTSATTYPAPYGNWFRSARHDMLYTAAELQALGLSGGTLTSFALDIAQITGTTTYCNFSISVKCTPDNNIGSQFQSSFTNVFTPKTVFIQPGWNTYTFDQTYDWDGVSNLIVSVCFDKTAATNAGNPLCDTTYSRNSATRYTTTTFTSVIYDNADGTSQCGGSGGTSPSTSSNRPNARFGICQQGLAPGATVTWSPAANILGSVNDNNPLAQVFNNTTFFVDVDEGGCVGSASVNVAVDNSLQLEALPEDTGLCSPAPILLTAEAIGTPSPITLTCGANGTTCGGTSTNYSVGTGTATASVSSPYGQEDAQRTQLYYRASEIANGGMPTGIITALSFNVTGKNSSGPYQNFTISMGCTTEDSLGGFQTGLDVVYGPISVTTTAGANTYTLDAPFDWDGFSNVIVEVSWDNGFAGSVGGDLVQATNTVYQSVYYQSTFFGAPNPAVGATSRANISFDVCPPPPGEFTYLWTPSTGLTDTATGLPTDTGTVVEASVTVPTQYVVQVTDGNCIAYDTIDIDFFTSYPANLSGSNIGCAGTATGDLVSTPTGGNDPYDFEWGDGSSIIQTSFGLSSDTVVGLPAGTYYLTLTDNSGCQAFDSITLTVPLPLQLSVTGADISCFGEIDGTASASSLDGTPPYTFVWSTGDTADNLTGLSAGMYYVTVTDSSGCTLNDSILLIEPSEINITADADSTSCPTSADGIAWVDILGGGTPPYTIAWSNGQTTDTATGLPTGWHFVTVTDASGCTEIDSAIVEAADSFIITTTLISDASCFNTADGQASADVGGVTSGYTFAWSNGESTATATSLPQGPNTVTVTDGSGCNQTASITIGGPPRFFLDSTTTDATCAGGDDGTAEIVVTTGGTPPFTWDWSNGAAGNIATGLVDGQTYSVTVTDNNGCEEYATVTISGPPAMVLDIEVEPAECFGLAEGSATVTITGGTPPYIYAWSDGQTTATATGLAAGFYSVVVEDANGCIDSLSNIEIIQPANPLDVDTSFVQESCPNGNDAGIFMEAYGGTPPYSYSIDGGATLFNEARFNLLSPGTYDLFVTDSAGCQFTDQIELLPAQPFTITFNPLEDTIDLGDMMQLMPIIDPWDSGRYDYSWQPAGSLSCDTCESPNAMPVVTTVYELTVTDQNNCSDTAQFTVNVRNDKVLYVPNAFTPNGDGINDTWRVYAPNSVRLDVMIWNKWGEKVFESVGPVDAEWDGTFKGKVMPPDVFVYYIKVVYLDEQPMMQKGSVTILK